METNKQELDNPHHKINRIYDLLKEKQEEQALKIIDQSKNNTSFVKLLLNSTFKHKETLLHYAIRNKLNKLVKKLLKLGADPLTAYEEDGHLPFHFAIKFMVDDETLTDLFNNIINRQKAQHQTQTIKETLLKAQTHPPQPEDPNKKQFPRASLLTLAARNRNTVFINMLKKYCPEVIEENKRKSELPLYYALVNANYRTDLEEGIRWFLYNLYSGDLIKLQEHFIYFAEVLLNTYKKEDMTLKIKNILQNIEFIKVYKVNSTEFLKSKTARLDKVTAIPSIDLVEKENQTIPSTVFSPELLNFQEKLKAIAELAASEESKNKQNEIIGILFKNIDAGKKIDKLKLNIAERFQSLSDKSNHSLTSLQKEVLALNVPNIVSDEIDPANIILSTTRTTTSKKRNYEETEEREEVKEVEEEEKPKKKKPKKGEKTTIPSALRRKLDDEEHKEICQYASIGSKAVTSDKDTLIIEIPHATVINMITKRSETTPTAEFEGLMLRKIINYIKNTILRITKPYLEEPPFNEVSSCFTLKFQLTPATYRNLRYHFRPMQLNFSQPTSTQSNKSSFFPNTTNKGKYSDTHTSSNSELELALEKLSKERKKAEEHLRILEKEKKEILKKHLVTKLDEENKKIEELDKEIMEKQKELETIKNETPSSNVLTRNSFITTLTRLNTNMEIFKENTHNATLNLDNR